MRGLRDLEVGYRVGWGRLGEIDCGWVWCLSRVYESGECFDILR